MKTRVDLFFDVVSPYAWIGFEAMARYKTVWNIDLHLRPFFLGGIMRASGNQPPMMVPAKGAYMGQDLKRMRDYWSVPLNMLSDPVEALITKGSLPAMRFLASLQRVQPERVEDAARELWMRRWSRDQDIHLTDHLIEVSRKIGLSPPIFEDVIANIEHQDVKDIVKTNTQDALDSGAFGAPWIIIYGPDGKEIKHAIFGSDRFYLISDLLGEKFPGPMREIANSKL